MKSHLMFFGKVFLATLVINSVPQLKAATSQGNKFFK